MASWSLQHNATHSATHCNTMHHTATAYQAHFQIPWSLQHTAAHCSTLQLHAKNIPWLYGVCNILLHAAQHTAPHYSTLCHTATARPTHFKTLWSLQRTTAHCSVLQLQVTFYRGLHEKPDLDSHICEATLSEWLSTEMTQSEILL